MQNPSSVFQGTVSKANIWLHEIQHELGTQSEQTAYHALRAVMHTLRDRLPPEQAVHFAAQLPTLIRGLFYEGWHPSSTPVRLKSQQEFFHYVGEEMSPGPEQYPPGTLTHAVLRVVGNHVDPGLLDKLTDILPQELRPLLDSYKRHGGGEEAHP